MESMIYICVYSKLLVTFGTFCLCHFFFPPCPNNQSKLTPIKKPITTVIENTSNNELVIFYQGSFNINARTKAKPPPNNARPKYSTL